VLHHAALMF